MHIMKWAKQAAAWLAKLKKKKKFGTFKYKIEIESVAQPSHFKHRAFTSTITMLWMHSAFIFLQKFFLLFFIRIPNETQLMSHSCNSKQLEKLIIKLKLNCTQLIRRLDCMSPVTIAEPFHVNYEWVCFDRIYNCYFNAI